LTAELSRDMARDSMKEKRITAAEIAKIAGVSRSTVTGVVNDYSYSSDATKAKVREVIAEYG